MTKGNRAIKLAISFLLAISLFCCSFSVYAVDPTPDPTVPPDINPNPGRVELQLDYAAYIIWQVLDSWGINFDLAGTWEFTHDMKNWIIQFFLDYCMDIGETAAGLLMPWVFDYDLWGNLRINDTALEDIQNFAQWLINKYALSDNGTVVVGGYETVNGVTFFETDTFYQYMYTDGTYSNQWVALSQTNDNPRVEGYFVWHRTDIGYDRYYRVTITMNYEAGTYHFLGIDYDGVESTYSTNGYSIRSFNQWGNANNFYYLVGEFLWTGNLQFIPSSGTIFEGTASDFAAFILNAVIRMEGSNRIVTGFISLPTEDPNYNIGDSMILVGGEPDYQLLDWDGTVDVNNLPAIVSTGTLENPEIDQIYTNIPALVEEAGDSMEIMRQIIFRMPDGVLIALYGLLSAGVIFGFLRIMREH